LLGAGCIAYHNSFAGAFVLDDIAASSRTRTSGSSGRRGRSMAHAARPVVQFSLAVNYALGGLDAWGYHLFNLTFHLLAGLLLFGVVRRMFESERLRARYGRARNWLALRRGDALARHPSRRRASPTSFSAVCRGWGSSTCSRSTAASEVFPRLVPALVRRCRRACALGMGTKEVMASAPVVMLLLDRIFLAESFRRSFADARTLRGPRRDMGDPRGPAPREHA